MLHITSSFTTDMLIIGLFALRVKLFKNRSQAFHIYYIGFTHSLYRIVMIML